MLLSDLDFYLYDNFEILNLTNLEPESDSYPSSESDSNSSSESSSYASSESDSDSSSESSSYASSESDSNSSSESSSDNLISSELLPKIDEFEEESVEICSQYFDNCELLRSFFIHLGYLYNFNFLNYFNRVLLSYNTAIKHVTISLEGNEEVYIDAFCIENNIQYYKYDYLFIISEVYKYIFDENPRSEDLSSSEYKEVDSKKFDYKNTLDELDFNLLLILWNDFYLQNTNCLNDAESSFVTNNSYYFNKFLKNLDCGWELPENSEILLLNNENDDFYNNTSDNESSTDTNTSNSDTTSNESTDYGIGDLVNTVDVDTIKKPSSDDDNDSAITNLSLVITIADLEHLFGSRVILNIRGLNMHADGSIFNILCEVYKSLFEKQMAAMYLDADLTSCAFFYSGYTYDFDLLMDYIKDVFDNRHFPYATTLYKFFNKSFIFFWGFYQRHCSCVGLVFNMSGKFSKQLLTKARGMSLKLGKPSFGTIEYGVTYRYRQTTSETGVFGAKLYVFQKNQLKLE